MSYVLAMYDVQGKQRFIYSSKKCKEIVGASHLLADLFKDYLYPAAITYLKNKGVEDPKGIYTYPPAQKGVGDEIIVEAFSEDVFKERMQDPSYIGEVVYEGGGNFFVLYKDAETCVEINKIFTREVLKEIGTLRVLCTAIEVENFEDYKTDRDKLYAEHRVTEAQESVLYPVNTTPFSWVSPTSGRPFTGTIRKRLNGKSEHVTTEELAKYKKYYKWADSGEGKKDQESNLLDELVEERGNESLLAVIYIDGNNMGAKVRKKLEDKEKLDKGKSYDVCVTELRQFSAQIHQDYVENRIDAIDKALFEKQEKEGKDRRKVKRTVVAAGDEMTIICNARDAKDVVEAYFSDLKKGSSCAGIAIFHSHAPYADAYRIAEECCENAKSMMKKAKVEEVNLMDFHYCQGGIGISLENIREMEGLDTLISKPWKITYDDEDKQMVLSPVYKPEDILHEDLLGVVDQMIAELGKLNHSNVKILREAAQAGVTSLEMELSRMQAHLDVELDFSLNGKLDSEQKRKLIYDIVIMYDIWFRGKM